MTILPIQTVHGVTSPVVRVVSDSTKQDQDESPAGKQDFTTQLYRDETARRLEEHNRRAKG